MSLPIHLTTNEVKNAAGSEVEFTRLLSADRNVLFAQSGEAPNREHRIKVSHQETGSGTKMVRRSLLRVDKTVDGADGAPVTISFYTVGVIPVGNIANYDEAKAVCAELGSLCFLTGADSTFLYDGSGYGAAALINGSL